MHRLQLNHSSGRLSTIYEHTSTLRFQCANRQGVKAVFA